MASYPKRFFLRPQETILIEDGIARPWALEHLIASFIFGLILWGGLGVLLFTRAPEAFARYQGWLVAAFVIQLGLSCLYVWRRLVTTEYVVTDEATYARHGQIVIALSVAAHDRVTDLHVHTSMVGRLFGYSSLNVRTAGGGLWMPGLRDAYRIRAKLQDTRHEFLTRLLRESGRGGAPAKPGSALTSQCQCPECLFVFPVPATRPLDVTCPNCLETGTLFAEAAA